MKQYLLKLSWLMLITPLLSSAQTSPPENPLSLLSERNLEQVGLFASPDENGKTWGRLFQFGRNIGFVYNGGFAREALHVTANDPKVWTEVFLMRPNEVPHYDWLISSNTINRWQDIVRLAVDAPEKYRGNNEGDPCPKGYHMPTATEWSLFVPTSFSIADFAGKMGYKRTSEQISWFGETKNYDAEYYSGIKNEIIGIKMISEDNTHRTAYRWRWDSYGLRIEARWIGARYESLKDLVEDETFWTANDKSHPVVSRFLPASGYIAASSGLSSQRYNDLYYWSSEVAEGYPDYGIALWGFPYDDEMGEGGVAIYTNAISRGSAGCIRCMLDFQQGNSIDFPLDQSRLTVSREYPEILSICGNIDGSNYAIYTLEGKCLSIGTLSGTIDLINIAQYPKGIYLLVLDNKAYKFTR